ncbi:MAG: calcium-binding protein [Pikeienuella sp.]
MAFGTNGDDLIVYSGGDVQINARRGSDTVQMIQFNSDEAIFAISGNDITITTSQGVVTLVKQAQRELDASDREVEFIQFADLTLDEAGIRARALADQNTVGVEDSAIAEVITGTRTADVFVDFSDFDTLIGGDGDDTFVLPFNPSGLVIQGGDGFDILDLTGHFEVQGFGEGEELEFILELLGDDISFSGDDVTFNVFGVTLTDQGEFDFDDPRANINGVQLGDFIASADDLQDWLDLLRIETGQTGTSADNFYDASNIFDPLDGIVRSAETADLSGAGGNDTLLAGSGDNIVNGGSGADFINGRDGDDTLIGGGGADTIIGGLGDDSISGGGGNDLIFGGNQGEVLSAGGTRDTISGGSGDDTITADIVGNQPVIIDGDAGIDVLDLSHLTADQVRFDIVGDDLVIFRFFDDPLDAPGNDGGSFEPEFEDFNGQLVLADQFRRGFFDPTSDDLQSVQSNIEQIVFADTALNVAEIHQRALDDQAIGFESDQDALDASPSLVVTGTRFDDTFNALDGDETVRAGDGDDVIIIPENENGLSIEGGRGFDTIDVSATDNAGDFDAEDRETIIEDYFIGESEIDGDDLILAGEIVLVDQFAVDIDNPNLNIELLQIFGFEFTAQELHEIFTSSLAIEGAATIVGFGASDNLVVSGGAVAISGLGGDDTIDAGDGDTRIDGGAGSDVLFGRAGDDRLLGRGGADEMNGGADNDDLRGGSGDDTLTGGIGNDDLQGGNGADVFRFAAGDGTDFVVDFALGEDSVEFTGLTLDELSISGNAAEVNVSYDGGLITFGGVSITDNIEDGFIFL